MNTSLNQMLKVTVDSSPIETISIQIQSRFLKLICLFLVLAIWAYVNFKLLCITLFLTIGVKALLFARSIYLMDFDFNLTEQDEQDIINQLWD